MNKINNEKPFDRLTQSFALIALICSLPVYVWFSYLGDPGRGRVAAMCFAIMMVAFRARWDLRNHKWFWIVGAFLVILHLPPLIFLSWSNKSYPGYTLMPIALVDFGIYYCAFLAVERMTKAN